VENPFGGLCNMAGKREIQKSKIGGFALNFKDGSRFVGGFRRATTKGSIT